MLTQKQIERMPSHARYWEVSEREEKIQTQRELQALALTPSHMLPFFSISDYEAARKGESVPIEQQSEPIPFGFWQIVDNRSISEYLQAGKHTPINRTISQYLEGVNDAAPLYMFVWPNRGGSRIGVT